jgi:uncharacterized protein
MKALFAALLFITCIARGDELTDRVAAIPNPRESYGGWVADPAGVIAKRKDEINGLITTLDATTTAEIAVVVVPSIGKLVPKDFAVALLQKWGVGKQDQDNGVLVLHVLDQRRIEIETGYGMEGILPDVKCLWIVKEIAVPFFRAGNFADGHYEVVQALARGIRQPDIRREDLLAQRQASPGVTVQRFTSSPVQDLPARHLPDGWLAVLLLALGVGAHLSIMMWYWSKSAGKTGAAKYQLFDGGMGSLQPVASFLLAGAVVAYRYAQTGSFMSLMPALILASIATALARSRMLKRLRNTPRSCECGELMQRLDEQQENTYLPAGNVVEQALGSASYDVWVCECGRESVESYKGSTSADKCDGCGYLTDRVTESRTLQRATTESTGLYGITRQCAHCDRTRTDTRIIRKRREKSNDWSHDSGGSMSSGNSGSSGSSGGSGSSSGGSFGGGRSGGGGAGSSY